MGSLKATNWEEEAGHSLEADLVETNVPFCCGKRHWKRDCPKLQKKQGKASTDAIVAECKNDESYLY